MTITTDPKDGQSGRGTLGEPSAGSEPVARPGLGYSLPDLRGFTGLGVTLPMTVPAVVSLTSVTSTAPYGGWAYLVTTGQTVTFTLTTNEAVRVAAGTTLTLSNGATAVYTGDGSASASNTFVYTVGSGDASARELLVTGYSGSIADQGGQTLNGAGVTENTTVEVYFGTTTFSVSNQDQMSTVFHSIDIQGPLDRSSTAYSVSLTSDFALALPPDAINVQGSDTLLFDGGGHTISGGPYELFLIESGAVTFKDLSITGAQPVVMRGGQSVTLEASAGQSMAVSGPIANEYGSNAGLIIQGAGVVILSGANTFAGGISLQSGVLDLANSSAAGGGEIIFAGPPATLAIEAGDAPSNLIGGLAAGDVIDLKGIGLAGGSALAAAPTLTVAGSLSTVTLNLDPSQDFSSFDFAISSDGHGGTLLTAQAIPGLTDATSTGSAFVKAGQTVTFTLTTDQAVTVAAGTKLSLSNGATALYSGDGSASTTNTFVYAVGAADTATADLQVAGYTGSITDESAQPLDPSLLVEDTGVDVYKTGASITVATEDQLNSVLAAIDTGGPLAHAGAAYTITLAGDLALATPLDAINLAGGESLTINGAGHAIGGASAPLMVDGGQVVTFNNLNISSAVAQSGAAPWLDAAAGQTMTISGVISGIYGFHVNGQGTVVLTGANTFSGPMGLDSGVLDIANAAAAGTNDIDFDVAGAELAIEAGCMPANALNQLAPGDKIDLKGIGLASGSTLAATATLTVHGSTATETLNLDTRQDFGSFDFAISSDGHGGTLLTVQAISDGQPPVVKSLTSAPSIPPLGAGYFVTTGQSVVFTLTTNEAVTVANGTTLTLSNGATAVYQGSGSASASNSFTYVVGSASEVARDLQVTGYTGAITDQSGQPLDPAGVTEDTGVTVYSGTTSFSVSDRDQLAAVFHTIDLEGALSQPDTVYRITLTAPITGGGIDSMNLGDSDRLLIDGGGLTSNLASQALTITGGQVTFKNLNMTGARAITIAGGQRGTLEATAGQTMTVAGTIVDLYGPGPGIAVAGAGTVVLSAANTFAGGVDLQSGVLDLANASAAGSGEILFAGTSATLAIEAGDAPANLIGGLAVGDVIDLRGIGLAAGSALAAAPTLTVAGSLSSVTLNLDPNQDFSSFEFAVSSDGQGGTLLTAAPIPAATVAQYEAKLADPKSIQGRIAVVDTAAHIQAGLSVLEGSAGYLAAVRTVDAGMSLNLAQALALEKANLKITVPTGRAFVVRGGAANIEALSAAQISGLAAIGASSLVSTTSADISFTTAQTAALKASGLAVSAPGSFTVTENTATGYSVYRGGELIKQRYNTPNGAYEIAHFAVTGKPYAFYMNMFAASGQRAGTCFDMLDGSGDVQIHASGLTFTASTTNILRISGHNFNVHHHANEYIDAGGLANETFALNAGFGHVDLSGFLVKGAGHGVIDLSVSMFSYLKAGMSQAQELAAVLNHAATIGGTLVITDTTSAHDTLRLDGVTVAQLRNNPADVVFVGAAPATIGAGSGRSAAAAGMAAAATHGFIAALSALQPSGTSVHEAREAWTLPMTPALHASGRL